MIELVSVGCVVALTYLLLKILGTRPEQVFVSVEERRKWMQLLAGQFGSFIYVANVVATLTSLATVYVFFIGTTQLFGYFIAACLISIVFSSFTTRNLTEKLCKSTLFQSRLSNCETTTAAITSLFWSEETKGTSRTIKILSQIAVMCVLWLEFATLTKLFSGLLGFSTQISQIAVMFFAVLFVFDFTFRNGLRGFLFADVLHFPLIFLGVTILLIGVVLYVGQNQTLDSYTFLSAPKLPLWWCIVFAVATLFLNSFLILTSESHWLRVWSMKDKVRTATDASLLSTAIVWLFLIVVGMLIGHLTTNYGWEAVVDVVGKLREYSIVFSIAFWVAAVAAIFSTADAQIYSLLVISAFKTSNGTLENCSKFIRYPFYSSVLIAGAFSTLLYFVEVAKLPFEPIVFFVFPIFLCTVPAFVELMISGKARQKYMIISIVLYLLCGLGMIIFDDYSFPLSLSAPLMPGLVSLWIWLAGRSPKPAIASDS